MKFRIALIIAAVAAAALATSAYAGTIGLKPLADSNAKVTVTGNSAHIVVNPGDGGGVVYIKTKFKNLSSKKLSKLVYSFVSSGDVQGGAPRWSIPIDWDNDPKTAEGYAFIDAPNCGATAGVPTLVSTSNPDCKVYFDGTPYKNWTAFIKAHPDYKLSKRAAFIIADVPGDYEVSEISYPR